MPELPDLQVFSSNLTKKLAGKKLEKIRIINKRKLKIPEKKFKVLEKQKLMKVYREGKELRFVFNKNILGLHLMLKGNLYFFEKKNEHKYTIAELVFKDTGLAVTDYQGMAAVTLDPVEKKSPDALNLDVKYLKEKLSKSRTIIKKVLMDQNMIRGIGNAYADEILWEASIHPESVSGKIPGDKIKALAKAIKKVLQRAEKQILKKDPGIISGEVRDFLDIHNSRKKESPSGATIHQKMIGGRKTYYTNEQQLFK